jgi:hypothetical protein
MPDGARAIGFERAGRELVAAWAPDGVLDWTPPRAAVRVVGRDGAEQNPPDGSLGLTGSVRYVELERASPLTFDGSARSPK